MLDSGALLHRIPWKKEKHMMKYVIPMLNMYCQNMVEPQLCLIATWMGHQQKMPLMREELAKRQCTKLYFFCKHDLQSQERGNTTQ